MLEQYANTGTEAPSLGLLHFPHSSLNSHLTYGQYHTTYCLVMQCSIVWAFEQIGSSRCNRDHCYIYQVSPTVPFTEAVMLLCIYSSIHSPNVYREPIVCQNPFYRYAEDMNYTRSLLLQGLHLNKMWQQTNKKNTVGNKYDRIKIGKYDREELKGYIELGGKRPLQKGHIQTET